MHRFARIALAAAAALAMTTLSAPAQGLSIPRWGQVWGTFVHQIQMGPGMKMPALITLNVDGSVTGAPGLMFGGLPDATVTVTPVFGVWQRTGWQNIASTSLLMVFDRKSGVLTGFWRSRTFLNFSDDFNSYTGTEFLESLTCASPLTCPDPLDPKAAWQPVPGMPASVPISGTRVEVTTGPLKP
jgi:hypothetical protein